MNEKIEILSRETETTKIIRNFRTEKYNIQFFFNPLDGLNSRMQGKNKDKSIELKNRKKGLKKISKGIQNFRTISTNLGLEFCKTITITNKLI